MRVSQMALVTVLSLPNCFPVGSSTMPMGSSYPFFFFFLRIILKNSTNGSLHFEMLDNVMPAFQPLPKHFLLYTGLFSFLFTKSQLRYCSCHHLAPEYHPSFFPFLMVKPTHISIDTLTFMPRHLLKTVGAAQDFLKTASLINLHFPHKASGPCMMGQYMMMSL